MLRSFTKELEEDREFEIGGETFQFRILHWTDAAALLDGADDTQPEGNGQISFRADTEFAIQDMPKYLDPADDSAKRWKALVARKTNPVPRHQIVQAYVFARTQSLGLPTTPRQDSSGGGGNNDPGSSAASSSPEETSTT
jgi:hypothetical protein